VIGKRSLNIIGNKLGDNRSKKVVFVSHCILNENTRYFGGAFRRASMFEVIKKLYEQDIGIVQMKCPEQIAWGGVQKRFIWRVMGSRNKIVYKFRALILPVFMFVTRLTYRRLARDIIRDILDYVDAGCEIVGVIGVDGSPSCGVLKRLNLKCSLEVLAALNMDTMNSTNLNDQLYSCCLEKGKGVFVAELKRQMKMKNVDTPIYFVDIIREMQGEKMIIQGFKHSTDPHLKNNQVA
jgi:predicted secreted protein